MSPDARVWALVHLYHRSGRIPSMTEAHALYGWCRMQRLGLGRDRYGRATWFRLQKRARALGLIE